MAKKRKNLLGNFHKCAIKKGDFVRITTGDDKKKTGTVLKVNTKRINGPYLIVEGVNLKTHFVKKQGENPGGMVKKESWIHVSNVKKEGEENVKK